MVKRLFLTLLTAALLLSACARPTNAPQDTTPTPPSIQASKTPLELLTEAVTNTKNAGACTMQYGTITTIGDDKKETLYTQTLSPEHPLDWDTLYAQIPDFPTNEHLLSDFCTHSLQAIPSNTGIIRYEVTDLTGAEMSALLYAQAADEQDIIGTVAIEVDASNRFVRLECLFDQYDQNDILQSTVMILLTITDF